MNAGQKVALVTGASRGIGRAIAQRLAADGARIVGVARTSELLDETLGMCAPSSTPHEKFAADLTNDDELQSLLEWLQARAIYPDIIVNNLGGSLAKEAWVSTDEWSEVWMLNVGIAHSLNLALVPRMREQRWGRLVHVSTLSARTFNGYPPYVSAKCALEGYVKAMARTLSGDGVVMSAVAPGAIRVEGKYLARLAEEDPAALGVWLAGETKAARLGEPHEVASAVSFLCSDDASYMSGAIVEVDGGG